MKSMAELSMERFVKILSTEIEQADLSVDMKEKVKEAIFRAWGSCLNDGCYTIYDYFNTLYDEDEVVNRTAYRLSDNALRELINM